MNQNACIVVMIVRVAADVGSFIANQYLLIRSGGKSLSQHTSCESSAYN
jgi:hypothetical protein